MIRAYVLVQAEPGKGPGVTQQIVRIAGVVSADDIAGPYDVMARGDAADLDELARLIVAKIQDVEGLTRTLTCPVVVLES